MATDEVWGLEFGVVVDRSGYLESGVSLYARMRVWFLARCAVLYCTVLYVR